MKKIKCDECGAMFYPGSDKYGVPNGVGFELDDGTKINVCKKCVMKANAAASANIRRAISKLRKANKED